VAAVDVEAVEFRFSPRTVDAGPGAPLRVTVRLPAA
jgi:hypothetical protein